MTHTGHLVGDLLEQAQSAHGTQLQKSIVMDKNTSEELRKRVDERRALKKQWKEAADAHREVQTKRFATLHAKFSDLVESNKFEILDITLSGDGAYFSFEDNAKKGLGKYWHVEPCWSSGNVVKTGKKVFLEESGFSVTEMTPSITDGGVVETSDYVQTFPDEEPTWDCVLSVISDQIVRRDK